MSRPAPIDRPETHWSRFAPTAGVKNAVYRPTSFRIADCGCAGGHDNASPNGEWTPTPTANVSLRREVTNTEGTNDGPWSVSTSVSLPVSVYWLCVR